jgi:tRNA/rRNA methyltransferase
MPFYTYIVRCGDASYYTGHTDDLEKRISDHNSGGLSAYTRKCRPVKLVWSEEFYSAKKPWPENANSRAGRGRRRRR